MHANIVLHYMKITRQLIQLYLDKQCSPEEELLVKEWIAQHPDELNRLMTDQSWEEFSHNEATSVEASPSMFKYILRNTQPATLKLKWMAAASVLLLLSGAMYYAGFRQVKTPPITLLKPLDVYILCSNNLSTEKKILLPDGSIVKLSPGSSIRYDSALLHGRDIVLRGEASFSVAKDSTKPFCVHTRNLNVTALGTVFTVADRSTLFTSVKLYEGKVVIKKENNSGKKFKEVFLKPGQELSFNNNDFSYRLSLINQPGMARNQPGIIKLQPKPTPSILNFNNQPLSEIFKILQKQYLIKIIFKTDTLEDMRFTGTHNPASESLEDFINTLAILNDLKVEKKSDEFIITPN